MVVVKEKRRECKRARALPFSELFSLADSTDVALMIVGTVGAIMNGAGPPLLTLFFGDMVNVLGRFTDVHRAVDEDCKIALKCGYLGFGVGAGAFLQVACWMATAERQAARIRHLYLKSLVRQEIAFFDKEANTGEVIGSLSGDTILIQEAIGEKVGKFIQIVSTFIGGFVVAFTRGWELAFVMLLILPPLVIAGAAMSTTIVKMSTQGVAAYSKASVVVQQTIGLIRTVASFSGESQSVSKYRESLKSTYKSSVREGLAAGLGQGTIMLLLCWSFSLGIWYGSKLILNEGYTGGDSINVIIAILCSSMSLGQASPCIAAFGAGRAAGYKVFETIKRAPEIDAYDPKGKKPDDIHGEIEFRNVNFSYPTRPDEQIFRKFSLVIPSGKSLALVGQSGSGKSTVISLIERFYDPQAGEILIDGMNLKELQLRWIRRKIGLVSQEPILFASSIRDNIAYGKDDATVEEIMRAAELANASIFINTMPQGMDTMVGDHGTQLSGGQKQRIAIARAILKDPKILLLDEATSALDSESERIVQEALDRIMENQTTVTVAHRLSTVRNADLIAVLNQGLIVEKGSHNELLRNPDGAYCQLIQLQDQGNHSDKYTTDTSVDSECNLNRRLSFSRSIFHGAKIGSPLSPKLPTECKTGEGTKKESNYTSSSQNTTEVPIYRLAYLNKPEVPQVIFGCIGAIVAGALQPTFGIFMSYILKTFYEPAPILQKDSIYWSNIFLVCGVLFLLAHAAKSYFFSVVGSNLVRRVRLLTFEKVVNTEIGWFDDSENLSGTIGARLVADAATVRVLTGDALALAVLNIATLISGLTIAFSASWQLSLVILALIPVLVLNQWLQIKFMKGSSGNMKMMYEEASQVANDAVGSIRTVASFSAEENVVNLYDKKCKVPMKSGIKQGLISGLGFGVSFILLYWVYAINIYIGAHLIEDGKTTFLKLIQVFFSLSMAAAGISQSSSLLPDSAKAKSATASVFAILDRKSKIDPSRNSGTTLDRPNGDIEFRNVSFRYPSRPDVQVFQDFCLAIQSGKTVALVGESGSGKSTAISLLQRFYDPDSGQILLDGIEIKTFQLRWLRKQMGTVSQEPALFNDTIRANIAYGKEGTATESEILAASESSNAHSFISSLQQGYATLVGERGTQLSGGQKQRVAIARAIIRDPKILLLDEATSALDAESERVVQEALDRVMANRTTIIVAHRLSTIRSADLIGVVRNGMIVEKGNHETLINIRDGAYASLVAVSSRTS